MPGTLAFNIRFWVKQTFEGRNIAKYGESSYFKRTRLATVGTAQITPPLPKQKAPSLERGEAGLGSAEQVRFEADAAGYNETLYS